MGSGLQGQKGVGMAEVAVEKPAVLDIRDVIRPLPSQKLLLEAQYQKKYLLWGGAAGPGKSYGLRWSAVDFLLYHGSRGLSNVRVMLASEDYPTLRDRHISKIVSGMVNRTELPYEEAAARGLLEKEFPPWLGQLRDTGAEGLAYFLNPQFGGGQISLRNLDDPSKYASSEWAAIYVDELTKNPRPMFDALRFRLRWPGIEHSPFVAGSNPGSRGHSWVKKLWIDRDFSGDDSRLDPNQFQFIPARVGENIHQPASYWDTLDSLPRAMREAMLNGNWDIFAGQMFDEWREEYHICDPFEIPPDWFRLVSVDYGYAEPFCALWGALTPDRKHGYLYNELYKSGVTARDQARAIKLASGRDRIDLYAGDPSMWQRRQGTIGGTVAHEYLSEGISLVKANNDRLAGWAAIHEALQWRRLPDMGALTQPPKWQVFRGRCPNLVRTLPGLSYDTAHLEWSDTKGEDHAPDALRYLLMAVRTPRQPRHVEVTTNLSRWRA